jgi:hypothetical protein
MVAYLLIPVLLLLAGCRPGEGSQFRGDDRVQIATLCKAREISASDDEYWMTVTVKHRPDVEVDWSGSSLQTTAATIRRHNVGDDKKLADGWVKRMETFWVQGQPPERALRGANAKVGPFLLRYRVAAGDWRETRSEICDPGLRP